MRPRKISDREILKIAKACVLKEGPSVSTKFIAQRVGVSQATLFKRFGSKEFLIREALMLPVEEHRIFDVLNELPDFEDPKEQFIRIAKHMTEFFNDMVPCFSMMHSAGIFPVAPQNTKKPELDNQTEGRKALQRWLCELQEKRIVRPDIDCEVMSVVLLGAFQSLAFRKHVLYDNEFVCSDDDFLNEIVDFFWKGLMSSERESLTQSDVTSTTELCTTVHFNCEYSEAKKSEILKIQSQKEDQ